MGVWESNILLVSLNVGARGGRANPLVLSGWESPGFGVSSCS